MSIDTQTQTFEMHVIPNTHWDREWIYDFQETRLMLVDFIDGLLAMLEAVPDYTYLLDAQVVPLEDYLTVRPERRADIEKFVANGQLEIGPWYSALEPFCVNGESIVRNLLIGHRVCRELAGVPMKIGYTPFGWGQPTQMPQIYQGFGIDTMLFYRGVGHWNTQKAEFIWESPDGSRVLASRLGSMGRYNFYMSVWRPLAYGLGLRERRYHWSQGGAPFHLCNEQDHLTHFYLLDPPVQYRRDELVPSIERLREVEKTHFHTRHLAFMHGMDSTAPDPVEFDILADAQKAITGDQIFFSSMTRFMENVKAEIDMDALEVKQGERRQPGPSGPGAHIMGEILSSRPKLKMLNTRSENLLQRWAEPFATLAWAQGKVYPARVMDEAWRLLLQNHAHDSAAGCGVDQNERDAVSRFEQVQGMANGVARRALQHLQLRIDTTYLQDDEMGLTIYNPSAFARTEVVTAVIDVDEALGYKDFVTLRDTNGQDVPVKIISVEPQEQVVRHLRDVTMAIIGKRITFQFMAEQIPGLGYKGYVISKEGRRVGSPATLVSGPHTLENAFLKVRFCGDGTVELTDKSTGNVYPGLHYFEDNGDAGEAWQLVVPPNDRKISSLGCPVEIALREDTPFRAVMQVTYRMRIPVDLTYKSRVPDDSEYIKGYLADGRTSETKEMEISSYFTLRKDSKALDVRTVFDNACKNHRLRVFFPTGIAAQYSHAETAFDVAYREIDRGPDHPYYETPNPQHPNYRFVDVSDGKTGFAVLNDGIREYEVTDNAARAIGLTLLRSFTIALCTVSCRWEMHPEQELSQAFGPQERRYAIYPHAGDWAQGDVFRETEIFNLPLKLAQVGSHPGELPPAHSFFTLEPSALILSAVKPAEDGQGMIVRLFNPTTETVAGMLTVGLPLAGAQENTLEELPVAELPVAHGAINLTVPAKKIMTVRLQLA